MYSLPKWLVVLMLVGSFAGMASANCGNDNGNGNGCSGGGVGPTGPQGPSGSNGSNGANGANGANGTDGQNGKDGKNGSNGAVGPAANSKASMIAGLQLRLFDTRYVSMFAFDDYQLDPQPSHNVIGTGAKNASYGARLVFKLGRDYTEERIDQLEKKIRRLEALTGN